MRELRDFFELKFKIDPCRQNQEIDINHKKLKEEKEEAEKEKKLKKKRNLQMPQEIMDDAQKEINPEEEENKKTAKLEVEEKEKSVQDYLRIGHEKLIVSCLGLGFSNLTKTLV